MYKHITGSNIGGHAVKLIVWGTTDDGEDYWVIVKTFYPKKKLKLNQKFITFFFSELFVVAG